MKLLDWILGRSRPNKEPVRVANVSGPGTYSLNVVGEASYQGTLEEICGGRTKEGQHYECFAALVLEDDNPYDKNAVRVLIDGHTVGYLSREHAPQFGGRWLMLVMPTSSQSVLRS